VTIEIHQRAALLRLTGRLADTDIVWALTGSLAHRLHGVPVDVDDIDIQTDETGAYSLADIFRDSVVRTVEWRPTETIRSHFGALSLHGITVEIMGALQKRLPDGSWESPVDVAAHRVFVSFEGHRVPVLTLEHEWRAYERLGRAERAAVLRQFAQRRTRPTG
jgi:hypothetical protein